MSGSSTCNSSNLFVDKVVNEFVEDYLLQRSESDLRRILAIGTVGGFPGYPGSWDCKHWKFKNRPVALGRHYKEQENKPTVGLEAITDSKLECRPLTMEVKVSLLLVCERTYA